MVLAVGKFNNKVNVVLEEEKTSLNFYLKQAQQNLMLGISLVAISQESYLLSSPFFQA